MKVMVFCECKLTSLESQTQNTHLKDRAELIFKRRRDLKNTKRVQKILIVISICDAEKRREMNAKQNTHSRYNRQLNTRQANGATFAGNILIRIICTDYVFMKASQ